MSINSETPGGGGYDGYYLDHVDTKYVYGDPNNSSGNGALVVALAAAIPGISAFKKISAALAYLGIYYTADSLDNTYDPNQRFKVSKYVYYADEPTMNSVGFYKVIITNVTTGEVWESESKNIGPSH